VRGRNVVAVLVAAIVVASAAATIGAVVSVGSKPAARGVVRPAGAPVPPFTKDFFGMAMGADLVQASDALFDQELNTMKKIGVHWVRASIPWSLVEPHGPQAQEEDWILVDRLVETVQAEGMQLIGIIDSPPIWAGASVPQVPGCTVGPPFQLDAYATFAATVAARYTSSALSVIEVENSPNLVGVWPTPDPCDYTYLLKQTYAAVKAVDAGIVVLNGGVGGTRNKGGNYSGSTWVSALYAHGAKGSLDALSFHPYSYPCSPSEGCTGRSWDDLPKVRQTMVNYGDGAKKIWATEFGSPTSGTSTDGHVTEARQSSIMVDAMNQFVAYSWAGPFFVFEFRDYGTDVLDKSDWFGLVSNDMKHRKPAFFAYQYEATGKGTPPAG
jgi:hypothetical protein